LKGVRVGLIENSVLLRYAPKELVVSNSKPAQKLFVILRGHCGVFAVTQTTFGEVVTIQYGSFSDGCSFGDQNLQPKAAKSLAEEQFMVFNEHTLMRSTLILDIKRGFLC
jgi:hypothetical protein